jgi:hypothetical protein
MAQAGHREDKMRKAAVVAAIAGALTLGVVASSAVAAPVGSAAMQIERASSIEKAHARYSRQDDRGRYRRDHYCRAGLFPFLLLPFIALAVAH